MVGGHTGHSRRALREVDGWQTSKAASHEATLVGKYNDNIQLMTDRGQVQNY